MDGSGVAVAGDGGRDVSLGAGGGVGVGVGVDGGGARAGRGSGASDARHRPRAPTLRSAPALDPRRGSWGRCRSGLGVDGCGIKRRRHPQVYRHGPRRGARAAGPLLRRPCRRPGRHRVALSSAPASPPRPVTRRVGSVRQALRRRWGRCRPGAPRRPPGRRGPPRPLPSGGQAAATRARRRTKKCRGGGPRAAAAPSRAGSPERPAGAYAVRDGASPSATGPSAAGLGRALRCAATTRGRLPLGALR